MKSLTKLTISTMSIAKTFKLLQVILHYKHKRLKEFVTNDGFDGNTYTDGE